MSIFRNILAIKAFREEKAEMAKRKQRMALDAAERAQEEAQQRLADFRDFAQREEREMYADLCRRVVVLREIEQVQGAIVVLRGQEHAHAQSLETAKSKRELEAGLLEERRVEHVAAARLKEKFAQMARLDAEQQLRALERKEDLELEEAAETLRDRDLASSEKATQT